MRTGLTGLLPAVVLLARVGVAQIPAPAELIDHLVANAEHYHATLPSITADEAIESEASYLIFHHRVEAKGVFRVVRNPATGELEESRQVTEVDGKPISAKQHAGLPTMLSGGFGRFQELFFTAAHRSCFQFTLRPQPGPGGTEEVEIAEQPEIATLPSCIARRITGLARIDRATQQIVYLERNVPEEIAITSQPRLAPYASVAIAPAKIGDDTFWLPTVVIGTFGQGRNKGKFTAHYSNYHRYSGSIKILPGVNEVEPKPEPAKPDPARPPPLP